MAVERVQLAVEGMSCQHCVNSIRKAVGGLSGVGGVEVNLAQKKVTVDFDPGVISLERIREAITEEGYEVDK